MIIPIRQMQVLISFVTSLAEVSIRHFVTSARLSYRHFQGLKCLYTAVVCGFLTPQCGHWCRNLIMWCKMVSRYCCPVWNHNSIKGMGISPFDMRWASDQSLSLIARLKGSSASCFNAPQLPISCNFTCRHHSFIIGLSCWQMVKQSNKCITVYSAVYLY